jgi:ribonuclease III
MDMDLSKLERKIKIKFQNLDLLRAALTHRSYLNENRDYSLPHNERLEFLGDAVLELVTTDYLYRNFENPEGELTNLRSALVNYRLLSEIAKEIGIEEHILLSHGEAKDTGRARQVILANALEAVIGAIYMDQGTGLATGFINDFVISKLPAILKKEAFLDPKSKLQELVQEKLTITPAYQVLSELGPDHAKTFEVGVYIDDRLIGRGKGPSKQEAEVEAAKNALLKRDF